MRLGIRILNSSSSLNYLSYLNQAQISPGETATVYFQLVDLEQGTPCGALRYMSASGATVSIMLTSLDQAKNITKVASNPFADDRSIWSFTLNALETVNAAGVNMKVTLTEGANVKIAIAEAAVIIGSKSPYSC